MITRKKCKFYAIHFKEHRNFHFYDICNGIFMNKIQTLRCMCISVAAAEISFFWIINYTYWNKQVD